LTGNSASIDSVQLTQATRPLRRLHIENLTSSVSEDMLIGCLNDFLLSSGSNHIQRSKQPCLSCTVSQLPPHLLVVSSILTHFLRNIYPHPMFIQCR
jgi:hypothetical protein